MFEDGRVEIVVNEAGERFGASLPVPDEAQPVIASAAASTAARWERSSDDALSRKHAMRCCAIGERACPAREPAATVETMEQLVGDQVR
jgi:hypothetical protein